MTISTGARLMGLLPIGMLNIGDDFELLGRHGTVIGLTKSKEPLVRAIMDAEPVGRETTFLRSEPVRPLGTRSPHYGGEAA